MDKKSKITVKSTLIFLAVSLLFVLYFSNYLFSVFATPAISDLALDFDGNGDYSSIEGTSATTYSNGWNEITISAWVYVDSWVNYAGIMKYANDYNPPSGGLGLSTSGRFTMVISNATNAGTAAGTGISAGEWKHLVGTYNGTAIKVYINGELNGTADKTGTISQGTKWFIGRMQYEVPTRDFNGKIDEVAMWNRSLNDSEILQLYNGGAGLYGDMNIEPFNYSCNGIWHMDDGPGLYTQDSSGQVRTGVIYGNPTWVQGTVQANVVFADDDCDSGTLNTTCYLNHTYVFVNGQTINGTGSLVIQDKGSIISGLRNINWHGASVTLNFTTVEILTGGNITGGRIEINTVNLTIFPGSKIFGVGFGFINGTGPGKGSQSTVNGPSGAGHGAPGGDGYYKYAASQVGGVMYGSALNPDTYGSGGGKGTTTSLLAGDGGGIVHLQIEDTLNISGTINVSGSSAQTAANYGGSGGSGGSIYIDTYNLVGDGAVVSLGGLGFRQTCGDHAGGPGAGGRIAVYYNISTFDISSSTVNKTFSCTYSNPGSLIFINKVDDSALVKDGFTFGGLSGLVNESLTPDKTFWNKANPTYLNFSKLNMVSGGTKIYNTINLSIPSSTQLTMNQTSWNCYGNNIYLSINQTNLLIDSSSSMVYDYCGYAYNQGPGAGVDSTYGGGAGHAQKGGTYSNGVGGNPYDSAFFPYQFGSGGGEGNTNGRSSGGGMVILNIDNTLEFEGQINVRGVSSTSGTYTSGGGSGGTIFISTYNITGAGIVRANGGTGGTTSTTSDGSGGRIAIWYNESTYTGYLSTSSTVRADITGSFILVDRDDASVIIKQGFQFQNFTGGIVNEAKMLNQTFWNTRDPGFFNFTDMTIIDALSITETISPKLSINVSGFLNITNSTILFNSTSTVDSFLNIVQGENLPQILNSRFSPDLNIFFLNSTEGSVLFNFNYTQTANNFTPTAGQININTNNVSVRTDQNIDLNRSATITLYNTASYGTKITRNGLFCPTTICKAMSIGDTYIFNVTGFTDYGIGDPLSFNDAYSENSFAISQFVKVNGTNFTLNGKQYKFLGVDAYYLFDYGTNHTYYDDGTEVNGSQTQVLEILDKEKTLNVNVQRIWAGAFGGNETDPLGSNWAFNKTGGHWNLFLNGNTTRYNETTFRGLDFAIYEGSKRDIRTMIVPNNNWEAYGGRCWWAQQSPTTNKAGADTCTDAFKDQFYNDSWCINAYQTYLNYTLNRVNTYSGKVYKEDPAIFAVLLMNEPRAKSQNAPVSLIRDWTINMTAFVKSQMSPDNRPLVGLGIEGFGQTYGGGYSEGTDMINLTNGTGADFGTYELHPTQWNFFANNSENQTNGYMVTSGINKNFTIDWWTTGGGYSFGGQSSGLPGAWTYTPKLARHGYDNWVKFNADLCNQMNLPCLLQEMAIPTNMSFMSESQKDRFFQQTINTAFTNGVDGVLFWNLNSDEYYRESPTSDTGLQDDGYSFYYSSSPYLAEISGGFIRAFNFTRSNNTGGTSWVTDLNNYEHTFYYNVTLGKNALVNCSLVLSVTNLSNQNTGYFVDQINDSEIIDGTNGTNVFTRLFSNTDNNLTWYTSCCDNESVCLDSDTKYILLTYVPVINSLSPEDNFISNSSDFILNYTVTDGLGINKCELFIDGVLNQTNLTTTVNVPQFFEVSISPGDADWQVKCTDTSLAVGYSQARKIIYDTGAMTAIPIAPEDFAFVNNATQNFTVNISSFAPIETVNLYVNGVVTETLTVVGDVFTVIIGIVNVLAEGISDWYFQVIDAFGFTTTSAARNVTVDTTFAVIEINSPVAQNYNYSNILINFTVLDLNLESVWYEYDDNGTLISYGPTAMEVTCTADCPLDPNILGVYLENGISDGRMSYVKSDIGYYIYYYPGFDNYYIGQTLGAAPIPSDWEKTDGSRVTGEYIRNIGPGTAKVSSYFFPVYNSIPEGYHNLTAYVNDSAGNINSSNVTFLVDTIYPVINFTDPTPINETVHLGSLYINASIIEQNLVSVTWNFNGTISIFTLADNSSFFTGTAPNYAFAFNQTGITLGSYPYYYNLTAIDSAGNSNNTESRLLLGDNTPPTVDLFFPNDGINYTELQVYLVANMTDSTALGVYNLTVYNSSNSQVYQTTDNFPVSTTSSLANKSFTATYDDVYNWSYYVCDTVGNCNQTGNWTVNIDSTSPTINIVTLSPNPAEFTLDTINFAWNATDTHLETSYFEILNSTGVIFTRNDTRNVTIPPSLFSEQGTYTFRVTANDSFGNTATSPSYVGVLSILDTVAPRLNVVTPLNNSEYNSNTVQIPINFRPYDETNLSAAWWTVYGQIGSSNFSTSPVSYFNVSNNQTFTTNIRWDQLDGTSSYYNIQLCANDTSNNVNCTIITIKSTVGTTPGIIGGGSPGGSGTSANNTLPNLIGNGTIDTYTILKQNYTVPPTPKIISDLAKPFKGFYEWAVFKLAPDNHALGVVLFWVISLVLVGGLVWFFYLKQNYNIKFDMGG